MKFSLEKQEAIKQYILDNISSKSFDIPAKTSTAFGISTQTVYRYLNRFISDGIIRRIDTSHYELVKTVNSYRIRAIENEHLEEDEIYDKYIWPTVNDLPQNVQDIWIYCFSEMMNNAIDHSGATTMYLYVQRDYLNTNIMIIDNGIGIFTKIKEHFKYASLDDAITELFKGKLTTDTQHHSGEGIFFTSQILDNFAAMSDGKVFSHNKYVEIMDDLDNLPGLKKNMRFKTGTTIFMKLSNFSHKKARDIFDKYSNDDGRFTKTLIPIKNIYETYPVSRSQAKRLCKRFDRFQEVTLDFDEINDIGQGFAHEIFVVFKNSHPTVQVIYQNANDNVLKMIHHVTDTSLE